MSVDKIIGLDARGSIFASVLCHRTRAPLVLARKAGKLPGSLVRKEFKLEYGTATMEIQKDSIDLEDAIDIREIKSIKLANQVLKIRRKKKLERDQRMQQENIQAQAQANAQQQQAAAQSEVQKQQALTQSQIQLEQAKSQMKNETMIQETELKKQLMELEFQYNMSLKGADVDGLKNREKEKEDRKDERTRIQATQQSEMIEQRKGEKPPKNFESAGNDILGGGFDLGAFDPK